METIAVEVLKNLASQGPLVCFLFYMYLQNQKTIEKKDEELSALNKECRVSIEGNLNKTNDAINNNTVAVNALKDTFRRT